MKRIPLFLIAALLPLLTFGQREVVGGIKLKAGVKVGANLTSMNADNWDEGYQANFLGGVTLGLRGRKAGIQVEGLFLQSTYQTGTSGAQLPGMLYQQVVDSARQGSFRLTQLSVPLLFMLRLPGGIWLQAGPQYKHTLTVSEKERLLKDPKALFTSDDVSAVFGLEFVAGGRITGGARYIIGLTDVNNIQDSHTAWQGKAIQIHMGYLF